MQFISVMAMLNFQQPLLQSSVSHDPSEIILICSFLAQVTFIIVINVENNCLTFCDNCNSFFHHSLINRKILKKIAFI